MGGRDQAENTFDTINNSNEIDRLISKEFCLETIEQLLFLQEYIQNNTDSLKKLSDDDRNKRILLKTEYTCTINDLLLIGLSENTDSNIKSRICKNTSIKFSFIPCGIVLRKLIHLLPEIKDHRFVHLYLNSFIDYSDCEKEKICKYLQQFTEVPSNIFPKVIKNIELNKNTIKHFLSANEFSMLFQYPEMIYHEIIHSAIFKTKNLKQLKTAVQSHKEFSLNLMALKILFKQNLTVDEVYRLFDSICSKCLKNVLIDFQTVNFIDDYRFFVFDLSPQIIYNSFDFLKTKKTQLFFRRNCLFFKYCFNTVDTKKFLELDNLSLPELMAISLNKKRILSTSDIKLIKEVDDLHSSNLLTQFSIKYSKDLKTCKYEEYLVSYEKLVKLKRQIGQGVFENEEFLAYLKRLKFLKSNERKELFDKIGAMDLQHILPNNDISGYYLFIEFILKGIFFQELETKTFLRFTDLKVLTYLELPFPFLDNFLKVVLLNVNTYNEEVVLEILHNHLTKLQGTAVVASSFQPLLLNILLFIKKILNGDFLTVKSLNLIQKTCLLILDCLENIEESNKMEMLLELIYEKVKLKSKYLKMKVKLKTVKK